MTINILNIDKSKWKLTKLGELANEISNRVDNPSTSKYERFVGLECFVSGDLKIKKSTESKKVQSSAKAFDEGDILLARRNAYLKRASLVEFEGCCSGDAFVLRENRDRIVPGFLAFIVNSEALWTFANSNAEGTMSKRVKWRDLANYEFLLPPKSQQAELAELLWAMDDVIEKDLKVLEELKINISRAIWDAFAKHTIDKDAIRVDREINSLFQTKKISIVVPQTWEFGALKKYIKKHQVGFAEGRRDNNGEPQLRMNNVTREGRIDLADISMIPRQNKSADYFISKNDVIFCNTNSDDLVGKTILASKEIENFYFSNHFTKLTPIDIVRPEFLFLYLKFNFDIGLFQRICVKWIGQAAVQSDSLLKLEIGIPPVHEQEILIQKYILLIRNIELVESKLSASKALQKALINQLF